MTAVGRRARPGTSPTHVLAIDIGSSSVRATVHGVDGTAGEGGRVPQRLARQPDGTAVLDPDEVLANLARAVDTALSGARRERLRVDAVAVSAMWHGLCGVDATDQVTVPVLSWADQRAAPAAAALRERLDDAAQHARTGARLHSSYLPAKLAWLARERPRHFDRTARWLAPSEFAYLRLFGEATASVSMASGTGLLDQHTCRYDPQVLRAVPLDVDRLPPVDDRPARGLREPYASRWPELAGVPWFPAIGDGAAANVGAGCVDGTALAITVGTSAAARVLWHAPRPRIPEGLWCYRLDADHAVAGGALNDGGGLVAWLRETVALPDERTTERALAEAAPGAHGLCVLPLLSGERSTGWHDGATGAVTGLTLATRPLDLLHACMEAVTLRLVLVAGLVEHALPGHRRVVATGAALSASPAWRQMLADALGAEVHACAVREASSRGAALYALHRLGAIGSLRDVGVPTAGVTRPDPRRHDAYAALLERQCTLYDTLLGRD